MNDKNTQQITQLRHDTRQADKQLNQMERDAKQQTKSLNKPTVKSPLVIMQGNLKWVLSIIIILACIYDLFQDNISNIIALIILSLCFIYNVIKWNRRAKMSDIKAHLHIALSSMIVIIIGAILSFSSLLAIKFVGMGVIIINILFIMMALKFRKALDYRHD